MQCFCCSRYHMYDLSQSAVNGSWYHMYDLSQSAVNGSWYHVYDLSQSAVNGSWYHVYDLSQSAVGTWIWPVSFPGHAHYTSCGTLFFY
ncbi:uncharacterized protein LOC144120994 isoform X14 [Amblyomma americanum]